MKRFFRKFFPVLTGISIFFFVTSAFAEIINQGDQTVRLSGRKKGGITGSFTVQAGETVSFAEDVQELWHVSNNSGRPENVSILIVEPDGKRGMIESVGGKYTLGKGAGRTRGPEAAPSLSPPAVLQPGNAKNRSNVAVYLAYVMPDNIRKGVLNLQPDQSGTFPAEAVEVTLKLRDRVRNNDEIFVTVMMPDGSDHVLSSDGATVRAME